MTATTSTDLASFLLARLSEDEEAAREATPGPWTAYGDGVVLGTSENPEVCRGVKSWNLAHISTFDPARVLAECASKRAQIEHLIRFMEGDYAPWNEDQLRMMAAPFADHPDFDESWRP